MTEILYRTTTVHEETVSYTPHKNNSLLQSGIFDLKDLLALGYYPIKSFNGILYRKKELKDIFVEQAEDCSEIINYVQDDKEILSGKYENEQLFEKFLNKIVYITLKRKSWWYFWYCWEYNLYFLEK